jgi:hypothetical protein
MLLAPFSHIELYVSDFRRLILNEHSFDHITQEHASQLRLSFDHFDEAIVEHRSFVDVHQLDQSEFHLIFANLRRLTIEQTLFDTITQRKRRRFASTSRSSVVRF